MLKVENVTRYYGDFKAVDDLSFEVKKGEIFGLLGVNGAGKTTTFRMMVGLLEPTNGNITIDEKEVSYDITDEIGFLTEERSLLTKLTVKEQVIYYGILKNLDKKTILGRLDYWLQRFDIVGYKERKIKELSKGNQQKIQFITAIINEPKLLILDEPFTGLDPINVELFMSVIKEFEKKGSMIIFSSHRMEHVELFCEKLVILKDGRSVLSGYLKDIKKSYRKKNIFIKANASLAELEKIKGVTKVTVNNKRFLVTIEDESYIEEVFKYVLGCKNVTEFLVEEPSLNEIFIAKVGEKYDK